MYYIFPPNTPCRAIVQVVALTPEQRFVAEASHRCSQTAIDALPVVDNFTGESWLFPVCGSHGMVEPEPIERDDAQPCYCEWDSMIDDILACEVCEPVDASL